MLKKFRQAKIFRSRKETWKLFISIVNPLRFLTPMPIYFLTFGPIELLLAQDFEQDFN